MKRRILYAIIISLLLIIISINQYFTIEYGISLLEYLTMSQNITEEERKWLNEHGSIIYGADQNSPPLRYLDEESGQYQGVVVDYIRALSIELGVEIKFKPLVWDEALKSLAEGKTDVCDMFPSPERAKLYDFSDPIYNLRGVILVSRDENEIHQLGDLKNKTVAVPKGDFAVEFLKSKVKDIDFVLTPDIYHAINLIKDGKVRAVVGDEPVVTYFVDKLQLKDDLKILDPPIYELDCVLAVPKSEKMLLNILNKGIFNLKQKQTMEKIQQKWFGISAPFIKEKLSDKVSLIISIFMTIVLLIIYLFYSWNKVLKREVKKRTEELYISRNDLQTTFDGLTHLMIVLDKNCRIVNVNKAFCQLVNRDREEIIGWGCKKFPELLYTNCSSCIIKKTFIDGNSYQNEFRHGQKIFELSTYPLEDKMKRILKVLVMIKDITKERISEQQILHSSKMAAIGQLAAGVAHEIRNPLGLIRNYSYILKKNVTRDEVKTQKAIKAIEASVEKASSIIDNLLNFSRLSDNRWENINIKDFIDNIIKLEKKVMERKNIKSEVICSENLVCYINQESLKHILINLISNAIDAMPKGGLLSIKCDVKDNMLLLTCSDTGIGIDEKDLENIFNPFFTTKARGQGTGLGLYITYNEVQKFGGAISVKSKPNEGTTFYVTLPLKEGHADDKE